MATIDWSKYIPEGAERFNVNPDWQPMGDTYSAQYLTDPNGQYIRQDKGDSDHGTNYEYSKIEDAGQLVQEYVSEKIQRGESISPEEYISFMDILSSERGGKYNVEAGEKSGWSKLTPEQKLEIASDPNRQKAELTHLSETTSQINDTHRGGLGPLGALLGAGLMLIPGMQTVGGAIISGVMGGLASTGTIQGALTGAALGWAGGTLGGLGNTATSAANFAAADAAQLGAQAAELGLTGSAATSFIEQNLVGAGLSQAVAADAAQLALQGVNAGLTGNALTSSIEQNISQAFGTDLAQAGGWQSGAPGVQTFGTNGTVQDPNLVTNNGPIEDPGIDQNFLDNGLPPSNTTTPTTTTPSAAGANSWAGLTQDQILAMQEAGLTQADLLGWGGATTGIQGLINTLTGNGVGSGAINSLLGNGSLLDTVLGVGGSLIGNQGSQDAAQWADPYHDYRTNTEIPFMEGMADQATGWNSKINSLYDTISGQVTAPNSGNQTLQDLINNKPKVVTPQEMMPQERIDQDTNWMLDSRAKLDAYDPLGGDYGFYQDELQQSYTDPMSIYNGPEFQGLQDLYREEIERKDAAAGRRSQYGARAVDLQNNFLKNLEGYRGGLNNAAGTAGTNQSNYYNGLVNTNANAQNFFTNQRNSNVGFANAINTANNNVYGNQIQGAGTLANSINTNNSNLTGLFNAAGNYQQGIGGMTKPGGGSLDSAGQKIQDASDELATLPSTLSNLFNKP